MTQKNEALQIKRKPTRAIHIGPVQVGGGAPVVVQSMTNTDTRDVAATLAQIQRLAAAGGRLYLSGLAPQAMIELATSTDLALQGPVRAFEVTPVRGESTRAAIADAEAWLLSTNQA